MGQIWFGLAQFNSISLLNFCGCKWNHADSNPHRCEKRELEAATLNNLI